MCANEMKFSPETLKSFGRQQNRSITHLSIELTVEYRNA